MITLSDDAKQQLGQFLSSSLYARAKHIVLDSVEVEVLGSMREATQTGLDLALKEGMSKAFRELEALALPQGKRPEPVAPRTIQKRKNTER